MTPLSTNTPDKSVAAFPIHDPDLAALSELLHRMTMCQEDTPATRYAWQAIGLLRAYLLRVSNSDVTR